MIAWHEQNREHLRLYNRAYYVAHQEKLRYKARDHYIANRKQYNAYTEKWRIGHQEYLKIYNHRRHQMRAETNRALVLQHYGNHCALCNCHDASLLTVDHVTGGGNQHRKQIGRGNKIYQWLVCSGYPQGFRLLCWNCNCRTQGVSSEVKQVVIRHYGNKCNVCGIDDMRLLTIDHINNNGNQHRKEIKIKGGIPFYRWLIRNDFPREYQILCWNCNCTKSIRRNPSWQY